MRTRGSDGLIWMLDPGVTLRDIHTYDGEARERRG